MNEIFIPALKLDTQKCSRNGVVDFLCRALASEIHANALPGQDLVSVRKLASQLLVAPQTVQKVYNRLSADGIISRLPGRRFYQISGRNEINHCLGFILPMPFMNYFKLDTEFGERRFRIYSGIVDRATELGFTTTPVMLPPPDARQDECDAALLRLRRKCCGLIHFGNRGYASDLPLETVAKCREIAQISVNCIFAQKNVGAVTFDPVSTISVFLSYIREHGHRRFAFVTPHGSSNRLTYYVMTHRDAEDLFRVAGVGESEWLYLDFDDKDPDSLKDRVLESLRQPDPPTVFWCRNDDIAIDLLNIFKCSCIRVPQDVSVMGFNNLAASGSCTPPLSSFDNPFYKMGMKLVDRLMLFLKSGITEDNMLYTIPTFIVPRDSVGARHPEPFLKFRALPR